MKNSLYFYQIIKSSKMKNITERFVNHPSYLRNGAKTLAKSWKCSEADVILAREEARIIIGKPKKSGGNPEAFNNCQNSG